jgi:CMP-N,N'-diacetyllegionaminic acid synthase
MRTVTIIPARGGSKGIKNKNLIKVSGQPLLKYVIVASLNSNTDETWVSSDSDEILAYAHRLGAKTIKRPLEFSNDFASSESALLHFADKVDFEILVFLQATSPLIISEDINKGINMMMNYDSVVSVTENNQLLWSNNDPLYKISNRKRRQDLPQSYLETGGIFITTKFGLIKSQNRLNGKIGLLKLPKIRSFDIDTVDDIEVIEAILNERKK